MGASVVTSGVVVSGAVMGPPWGVWGVRPAQRAGRPDPSIVARRAVLAHRDHCRATRAARAASEAAGWVSACSTPTAPPSSTPPRSRPRPPRDARPAPRRPAPGRARRASAARAATPETTLPDSEERSKAPSPVTTRSACATRSARPTTDCTSAMPGSRRAPSASSAAPSPPAAPAPGCAADLDAEVGLEHVGPAGERAVEQRDVLPARALLRPEDRRCPAQAQQRAVDVGRGDQLDAGQPGVGRARQPVHPSQRGTARGQPLPRRVEPLHPERGEQAGTAVVGGAAAQPDDHAGGAEVEGGARRAGRRRTSWSPSGRARRPPAGAARRPTPPRRRPCPRRAARRRRTGRASGSSTTTGRSTAPGSADGEHLEQARPAVGQRREVQHVARARRGASPRPSPPRPRRGSGCRRSRREPAGRAPGQPASRGKAGARPDVVVCATLSPVAAPALG